jgi:hypothetical protein
MHECVMRRSWLSVSPHVSSLKLPNRFRSDLVLGICTNRCTLNLKLVRIGPLYFFFTKLKLNLIRFHKTGSSCNNPKDGSDTFLRNVCFCLQDFTAPQPIRSQSTTRNLDFGSFGIHPASCPMGTGALPPGIELPRREVDHSPLSCAEVRAN